MYKFTIDDLQNGVLKRSLSQLGLSQSYAHIQVVDNYGIIQDDASVIVSWTDTHLTVDLTNYQGFQGEWKILFQQCSSLYTFTQEDLQEGILRRSIQQLDIDQSYVPVQVVDNYGVIQDGSSVVVSWTDTHLTVDLTNFQDFHGTWRLVFSSIYSQNPVNPPSPDDPSTPSIPCNIICLAEAQAGAGGVGGGGGASGQTSTYAQGAYATSYGVPVIKISTGMTSDFLIQLTKDREGTIPSNLSRITKIQFVCLTSGQLGKSIFKVECQNVGSGRVSFRLTPNEVNYRQGLHYAQIHCFRGKILDKVYKCCLQIQKSFIGSNHNTNYPLTIEQVRMQLYDTSGRNNQLLDDLQFSDVVIARCIDKAVSDWNQMPPTLANQQTAATFPYRSNLCTGAVGHALKMAAHRYYRNQMRHANAGLTMDDNDKGAIYMQLAQATIAQWRGWVQAKKNQINQLQCMGSISDGLMQGSGWWW